MFFLAIVIVICMTARAGGLVPRGRPIDGFRVGLMALSAGKVAAVIERLVCQPRVTVICRRPCIRTVTQTAILRGVEVIRILASRKDTVVTR